jgi:hypothetical protein
MKTFRKWSYFFQRMRGHAGCFGADRNDLGGAKPENARSGDPADSRGRERRCGKPDAGIPGQTGAITLNQYGRIDRE